VLGSGTATDENEIESKTKLKEPTPNGGSAEMVKVAACPAKSAIFPPKIVYVGAVAIGCKEIGTPSMDNVIRCASRGETTALNWID